MKENKIQLDRLKMKCECKFVIRQGTGLKVKVDECKKCKIFKTH